MGVNLGPICCQPWPLLAIDHNVRNLGDSQESGRKGPIAGSVTADTTQIKFGGSDDQKPNNGTILLLDFSQLFAVCACAK